MHHSTHEHRSIDWVNTLFIAFAHVVAVGALISALVVGVVWENVLLAVVWFLAAGLSITGGYHRLFSHKTYRASWVLRLPYLLFGAAAVQNSVINWSSDHRRHHADTDHDEDPYNSRKGFWWSHVGWVLYTDPQRDINNVNDLMADPLVAFQHKYYIPLAVLMVGIVPAVIGMAWGDPLGAFLWAVGVTLAGYFLGNIEFVKKNIELILVLVVFVSVIPIIFEFVQHRRGRREA